MIWKFIPLALLAGLTACASPGGSGSSSSGSTGASPSADVAPSATQPSAGAMPGSGRSCDAQPAQNLLGQTFNDSAAQKVKSSASSDTVRVLKPGQVMTLEYNATRVNIIVDGQGKISAIRCG
ncbi:I78 family peptidase inhibitor [Pseudomonadota bacterium AL_CKDN230030165-1A_HGKHYDSX7]